MNSPMSCPIIEQTADGTTVGRCWYWLTRDVCQRHGDVTDEAEKLRLTGELTLENTMRRRKGLPTFPIREEA